MEWFNGWWEGLTALQQILALMAIPATVILILQTVLLLFGLGGHDADHGEIDTDHDFDHDNDFGRDIGADHDHDFSHGGEAHDGHVFDHGHDGNSGEDAASHDGAHHGSGIRLFTVRGLIALFAVGGWIGIALCDLGVPNAVSVAAAASGGFVALLLYALVISWSLKLQESGNISVKNAVAHTAVVYVPIPPERTGTGKVTMTLQERFVEIDAVTDADKTIPTGTQVQVVSVTDKNELIVRTVV